MANFSATFSTKWEATLSFNVKISFNGQEAALVGWLDTLWEDSRTENKNNALSPNTQE